MRSVGLFRNVNQGQPGHPSTGDLLASLEAAGLRDAVAYRSNGTVVFVQPGARDPADEISRALSARAGYEREVFTLPLTDLFAILDTHLTALDLARRELTLHRGLVDIDDSATTAVATHRRCRLIASGRGWVVTANERDGESNATPVIERITGGPATSRGLPTMVGVAQRFA